MVQEATLLNYLKVGARGTVEDTFFLIELQQVRQWGLTSIHTCRS